jgi:hypothetical protein
VRKLVSDDDMPEAPVVDEMRLGKTFTLVAVGMLCKLVTQNIVMGLPQSIIWANTIEGWAIWGDNYFPSIVGEEREWYPLQRFNSVLHRLLKIQKILPTGILDLYWPMSQSS